MDISEMFATNRSMSSMLVASQEAPTRACFKRRSCDAALMLDHSHRTPASSIEGVLWSDDEEKEYLSEQENISYRSNKDLTAFRQLLENGTGGIACPSCNMPFDKGKKRKLIDTCGHERCFNCMFKNEACPLCVPNAVSKIKAHPPSQWSQDSHERIYTTKVDVHEPSDGRRSNFVQSMRAPSPSRLPRPPKQAAPMTQSCPTPPPTRRKFLLSPKAFRSPFGNRGRNENHPPLSDDEGGNIKPIGLSENRKNNQKDLQMKISLLFGDGSKSKRQKQNKAIIRDSCTSLTSLDCNTLASNNTSPVSTLTGSSEADVSVMTHGKEPTSDSIGSLMSMSLSGHSNCSSSPVSRRHSITPQNDMGFFKNRRTSVRRSARTGTRLSQNAMEMKKSYPPTPQLTLRPLFFEVPITEPDAPFIGRQWLVCSLENIFASAHSGAILAGEPGTGKTATILQLVEHSCFGRKKESIYEKMRDSDDICQDFGQIEYDKKDLIRLASNVVGYHFCQADNNSTCLVGEFVHSLAAQLCQSPRLYSYKEYLLGEPHLLACLSIKECIADPDLAFKRGIIEPLVILRRNGSIEQSNCMILIDGLCEAEYHRPDHGDTISSFLAKHNSEMPTWLKVIVTVKTQFIELTNSLPYVKICLDEYQGQDNVRRDLLEYINVRLQTNDSIQRNMRSALGKQDGISHSIMRFSQHLLHLSQGSFLYVKLILDLIEKGNLVLKSSNYKVLPVSLAQIFLLQFNLIFPTEQSFDKVTHILSVCLAGLYPLTLEEIYYSVNSLLVNTFLPWEEFLQRFSTLSNFLIKRIDNTYMFFHPSFREWLIRRYEGESTKFMCDLRAGHAAIAFRMSRIQSPLDSDKTMELGHHILKAHLYRNMGPPQLGICSRDLQAEWVSVSSQNVSQALATQRNIYNPNVKVSRLMLLAGGSPNKITEYLGNAPLLCIYAYQGILAMVGMLIEFGADVELTNSQGCTALILASQKGHTDVARRLVAAGASLSKIDQTGQTALVHAARNGHGTTVSYLLSCEDRGGSGEDVLGTVHALISASQAGHLNIVDYLLDTGELEINSMCSVTGETALTAACGSGSFCLAVVDSLIQRGANLYTYNKREMDPLCLAAKSGHNVIVERLLIAGMNPTTPVESTIATKNKIPLIIASAEGHPNVVEILLDHDADINATDADGISALGWACLRGRLGCVTTLLERGASVSIPDSTGRTPLCLACGAHPSIVEALLEKDAQVEWADHNGRRPLDLAIDQKNIPVVQCFLKKGAKLGPTTWAMAAGKSEILLILLNKLLEDGNALYRKGRLTESSHRYQYALKKINAILIDPITTGTSLSAEHLNTFTQLKTNFLINQSRCKRKLNELDESSELASQAIALRPDSFECYYTRSKAFLSLNRLSESLQDVQKALLLTPQNNMNVKKVLSSLQQEILHKITNKNAPTRDYYDTLSLNN